MALILLLVFLTLGGRTTAHRADYVEEDEEVVATGQKVHAGINASKRFDMVLGPYRPDDMVLRSAFYNWGTDLHTAMGSSCHCGQAPSFPCPGKTHANFVKEVAEYCIDFASPIAPGVKGILGIEGSMETVDKTKSMDVEVSGGVVVRLPPVAIMVKLHGSLGIESDESHKFSSLFTAAVLRIVNRELRGIKSDTEKVDDLLAQMNQQLADFDEGFNVGWDRARAKWRIAMAERIEMLQTSLGLRMAEVMRTRASFMKSVTQRLMESPVDTSSLKHGVTMKAHLDSVIRVMEDIAKEYGGLDVHKDGMTSGVFRKELDQSKVYKELLRFLRKMLVFETSRIAVLLKENVIRTLFDPDWDGHHDDGLFECSHLKREADVDLAPCKGSDPYGCYPKLHLGTDLDQADTTDEKLRIIKRRGSKIVGVTKGRMLCSLLSGWPEVGETMSLGGDNVDHLEEYDWELPEEDHSIKARIMSMAQGRKKVKIPYPVIKIAPSVFLYIKEMQAIDGELDVSSTRLAGLSIQGLNKKLQAYIDRFESMNMFTDLLSDPVTAVAKLENQELLETNWHLNACKQPGKEAGCAKQIKGWLLSVNTARKEQEKLRDALKNRVEQREDLHHEGVAFTWNFDGSIHVGVDVAANTQSICSGKSNFEVAAHFKMQQSLQFEARSGRIRETSELGFSSDLVATLDLHPRIPISYTLKVTGRPKPEPVDKSKLALSKDDRAFKIDQLVWGNQHIFTIDFGKFRGSVSQMSQIVSSNAIPFAAFVDAVRDMPTSWPEPRKSDTPAQVEARNAELKAKLQAVGQAGYGAWKSFKASLGSADARAQYKLKMKITLRQPDDAAKPWKISADLKMATDGLPLNVGYLQDFLGNVIPLGSISSTNGTVLDLSGLTLQNKCPDRRWFR